MKRSTGVTTMGVLMLLFGGCHSIGNGTLLIAPPVLDVFVDSMKDVEVDFEGTLDRTRQQRGARFSQQEVAEGEEAFRELRQALERLQQVLRTPQARGILALEIIVGILAVAAGLGVLRLTTWAWAFAIGQAWLALFIMALGQLLPTPFPAEKQDVIVSLTLGGWALVWNSIIIWFFSRRSTKAQCCPNM